jgi:VCBS repeat-containing protein
VTEDRGAAATRSVAITVHGANQAPKIRSSVPATPAVVEITDGAPGENGTLLSTTGTIAFADTDLSDTHIVSVTPQLAGYLGTFSLGSVNQGADTIGWTFAVEDADINFLGQGQVLTQYYDVVVSDGHGGTVTQEVAVRLVGSNDAADLSSVNIVLTQGATPASASGALTITDEDSPELFQALTDFHGTYGTLNLAADGSWSYLADSALQNLAATDVVTDSFTVRAADGTPTTINVSIAGSADVAVAQTDGFTTGEADVLGGGLSLFADNGNGADVDPDGPPLSIAAVNGDSAFVGQQLTLASGALLRVNADGTFRYDPNHAFDSLTQASGAVNQSAFDSFTYTLAGGTTATVIVTIEGADGAGDQLKGDGRDNVVTGFDGVADLFRFEQGGTDAGYGLGGNDGFYFGGSFDSTDGVDGGDGADTLALQGNTVATLGDVRNVEVLLALSGSDPRFGDVAGNSYDYDLTTTDGNVAAGQTLTVSATGLLPGEDLRFDGSAESDGNFRVFAGQGTDDLTGGAGSDGFFFGADGNLTEADQVDGGAGTDTLVLRGNYVGAGAVVFQDSTMSHVEVLAFLTGHANPFGGPIAPAGFDYDVTLADGNVAAGQRLDVIATGLGADESLGFDGSAETNGSFRILSGAGNDDLVGGAGNDQLYGGLGADRLEGGAGADTYVYLAAAESTSTGYDSIVGFDWHVDRIDAPGGTRGLSQAGSGALSTASFDADLAAGLDGVLGGGQAALFTATNGTLAGHVFAVIDANGVAGYQAGQDLVIELVSPITPIDPVAGLIL